jgi:hypothetical protein
MRCFRHEAIIPEPIHPVHTAKTARLRFTHDIAHFVVGKKRTASAAINLLPLNFGAIGLRFRLHPAPISITLGSMWVPHSSGARRLGVAILFVVAVRRLVDDRFERRPLRLHPDMAVVTEHPFRDMTGNVHDGLVAGTAFRQVRNERVAIVVPPAGDHCFLPDILPGRLEGGDGSRRIAGAGLPKGEQIPLWASFSEFLSIPSRVFPQDGEQG